MAMPAASLATRMRKSDKKKLRQLHRERPGIKARASGSAKDRRGMFWPSLAQLRDSLQLPFGLGGCPYRFDRSL
ncbi:MAG: hypothetical protein JWQ72_691 [Polaromonas sp.]|nr:hypothetical protein [Polaromonas sp.]